MASIDKPSMASDPAELNPSDEQLAQVHRAACAIVAQSVGARQAGQVDYGELRDLPIAGAFVTIKRRNHLRACCGALGAASPLHAHLLHAAQRTALDDPRFPPLSPSELPFVEVTISLLHRFLSRLGNATERLASIDVGRHGLQIRHDGHSGLLLPSVAAENHWDVEQLLRQTCRKAGLPPDAWRDPRAELTTFEAATWGAPFVEELLQAELPDRQPTTAQLAALAEHARVNLLSQYVGATPNFYAASGWDGNVAGLGLSVYAGEGEPLRLAEISLKSPLALQSTLLGLTEAAAGVLRQRVAPQLVRGCRVELTAMLDPALHGSPDQCDLRGLDPRRRAMLAMHRGHASVLFDRQGEPDDILARAVAALRPREASAIAVYSLDCKSTEDSFAFSTAPAPVEGSRVRTPAVAGSFYPADRAELDRQLDRLLDFPPLERGPWAAAMIPHAGLQYSGRLAADVLRRIEFPSTVICIGPKHTRLGVPWAIAPHEVWKLPNGKLDSDAELAARLAEAIPGLELDAAAHAREHAIEVELPFIARLAPRAKVVGIALGAADFEACERFAEAFAQAIAALPEPPLLLISSDMNHFANDADTRRLDRLALDAMMTLDPCNLYDTVQRNQISMCGVLPAVIVMLALRRLRRLNRIQEVGYATSGDVSGDRQRVVGYAGMLLGE